MTRLAKTILLSGLGINFLFFTGVVIFTKYHFTDKWVLIMYGSMILLGLWLWSGKTYERRR